MLHPLFLGSAHEPSTDRERLLRLREMAGVPDLADLRNTDFTPELVMAVEMAVVAALRRSVSLLADLPGLARVVNREPNGG